MNLIRRYRWVGLVLAIAFSLTFLISPGNAEEQLDPDNCMFVGISLYGEVEIVNSFPDIQVKKVESFADLHVEVVDSFPDGCGQWEFVDSFPDFTIQYVDSFPDITIKIVDSFPGIP
ncbi:hypothetical protein [Roseofilum casamattae]|uniref:7(1) septoil knot domain-containing protein n=1 Tax=Roseofilum casamattae BLCC-M143 TaxID=3022442 RepID=A0ABT7BWT5_9CYAN|nr:hypothetical protein [Roseofilum casamattae]MDJ1183657.1 hypothetical protein [Roseofilum casamattae BLCC-M143]